MADKNEIAVQESKELVAKDFTESVVVKIKDKEKWGLTFPKNYNYTNELMSAMLILQETVDADKKPVLESCSRPSIQNALLTMATTGLSMQKGQCYMLPFRGKLQCLPSVYGNTCKAREYGLETISAMVIYDGDSFKYHIENGEIVIDEHTQDFMNIDNEKIKGAYAVAKMNTGYIHVEVMNINQIKQAWKQGYGYKENGNGTHQKFTDQMAMKTVKNRCLKYIIRTFGSSIEDDLLNKSEDMESKDIVAENVDYDVEQNANTVDFSEVVPEDVNNVEVVDAEVIDESDLPDFMK